MILTIKFGMRVKTVVVFDKTIRQYKNKHESFSVQTCKLFPSFLAGAGEKLESAVITDELHNFFAQGSCLKEIFLYI